VIPEKMGLLQLQSSGNYIAHIVSAGPNICLGRDRESFRLANSLE